MGRRRLICFGLGIFLLSGFPTGVSAAQQITVVLDGEPFQLDVPPVVQNGRVLLPCRTIFEALGMAVDWDAAFGTVTVTKGGSTMKLAVGKRTAYRDGSPIELDVSPKVIKGRTFVPIRSVAEAFGVAVEWDPQKRTVGVYTKNRKMKFSDQGVLRFRKFENTYPPLEQTDKKEATILREDKLDEASSIVLYRMNTDPWWIYAAYSVRGKWYKIGEVGYGDHAEGIHVSKVNVLNQSLVKIEGFCGAACPVTDYLDVKNGTPSLFLQIQMNAREMDLDGDGQREIVASSGSAVVETIVLKAEDNQILSASLNEALGAYSVVVSEDGIIEAFFGEANSRSRFRLVDERLMVLSGD